MKKYFAFFLALVVLCGACLIGRGQESAYVFAQNIDLETFGASILFAGMILNKNTVDGITTAFNTLFNQALNSTETYYQRICMTVPSSTSLMSYNWMTQFPKMRQWVGDRIFKNLKALRMIIENLDWETSVEVDRNDILDDQVGVYNPIVSEMGASAAAQPDELIFQTLLPAGLTTTIYDGQNFFDTDHPMGVGGAELGINYAAGAGPTWYLLDVSRAVKPFIFQDRQAAQFVTKTAITDESVFIKKKFQYGADSRNNAGFGLWPLAYASKEALSATTYAAARERMLTYKDDEGKPLGVMPNLLVVPPTLEAEARIILLNERDAAGATNPWKGSAEMLMVKWLSAT